MQTEDEICAIGMAVGSALTGCRTATCTSGPGFSLMSETLGWAGINETPIVITLYQRSGPSTGLPTRHGQDDLMCAVHAGHGQNFHVLSMHPVMLRRAFTIRQNASTMLNTTRYL